MKSLRESGKPVLRPFFVLFLHPSMRRFVPLAALVAVGVAQAVAPAFALNIATRVGFDLPGNLPPPPDANGNAFGVGQIRPGSDAPLTMTLRGGETGDAQLLVMERTGMRSVTQSRAVHLTSVPQTFRMTLTMPGTLEPNFSSSVSLSIQVFQNGRSLAEQEAMLPMNLSETSYNVLALTGRSDALDFLRHSIVYINHRYTRAALHDSSIKPDNDLPRLLSATPESLPDSAQAYDAVDAVVLDSDYLRSPLEPEQKEALREYVRQGGRLILIGSADTEPLQRAEFRGSLGKTGWHEMNRFIFPSRYAPVNALISAKVFGAGTVLDAPPEVVREQIVLFGGKGDFGVTSIDRDNLWSYLLGSSETPLFSPRRVLANFSQQSSEMTDALAGKQAAQTVPFPLLSGFLILYIVLIVPVNYLVLKKLDRRELAWITAPALVFLFSGASYAAASAIKGGSLTVNRAVVYEMIANTDTATGYGQFTLYSPRRAAYAISIGDPNDSANPYRNTLPTETFRNGRASGPTDLTVRRDASTTLQNVAIPIWDTRSFSLPVSGSLGGGIEARVTLQNGSLNYLITNHTKYDLHGCGVVAGNQAFSMADIKAGESAPAMVSWAGTTAATTPLSSLPFSETALPENRQSAEAAQQQIEQAMQGFFRITGGPATQSRTVACGFVAYFNAKTLDVRVDGKSADGEQVNMLYAHLPLPHGIRDNVVTQSPLDLIPDANNTQTSETKTQESNDAE